MSDAAINTQNTINVNKSKSLNNSFRFVAKVVFSLKLKKVYFYLCEVIIKKFIDKSKVEDVIIKKLKND